MNALAPERISALPIRLRKRTQFHAARVSWKAISCRLVSLLLTYALLLQLVPQVAIAAGPEPRKPSPVAYGALESEKGSSKLGSLFSLATGAIESSFASDPANSLLSTPPPDPAPANGIAIVRHAPSLNGNGRVEGSLRQLTGESVTLNGGAVITADLQVPGTPTLILNGNPSFGGTIQGTGSSQPTNYQVILNGGTTTLGHLVTRSDPISLASVPAPPASQGTRSVAITAVGQSAGNFATLRDLTLNGNVGMFTVPAGTYRNFIANGGSGFVFGISGASQPSTYNLSSLTLNGQSQIQIVGPVNLTLGSGLTLNASMGSASNPAWLNLQVSSGGVTLNGGSSLHAVVKAPASTVTINGNAQLIGTVACDRLTVNGGGLLRLTESALPPVNQAPVVGAGSNQTITLPGSAALSGSVNDDGLPQGSSVTASWSKVSGPGNVNFVNANSAVTTATFSQPGTYVLRLTASDSQLTNSSDMTITVIPQNYPPTVNAGPDRTITLPASATLNGSAGDDGLPAGSSLSVIWSKVSGPGTVTFPSPTAAVTNASFSVAGTYVLRLTASDSQLTAQDDVQVVVIPQNGAPTVNAGADQSVTLPATATLNGSATDDGLPTGSSLSVVWSKVNGPGTVTFANPNAAVTTCSFTEAGTYVLRLTAGDSQLTAEDDLEVIVIPENHAPTADAGADQTITLPSQANFNGSANDDGLPSGSTLTTTWSKVSGPGTVAFGNPNVTVTTAALSEAGTYVLRLTVSDSQLTTSDELVVTVDPENQAPTVNAGADQTITLPAAASLDGSVADDGWPRNSSVTITWTQVGGPGTATFATPSAAATTVSFSEAGTYVLRLTASDSQLSSSDDIAITVIPENHAPTVDAGPDQTITLPNPANLNGSVGDDGLPVGSSVTTAWSKVSGPGTVTFGNPNVTVTTAAFSVAGAYVLRLTASDPELTASDDVEVIVIPENHPPTVDAGVDQTITFPNTGSLNGSTSDDGLPEGSTLSIAWTTVSGPGSVSFANPNVAVTTASFSAAGTYVIRFTANDSQLSASDDVTITVAQQNLAPTVNAGVDRVIALLCAANLQGTASDDGAPAGSTLSISWSQVSGPGAVSFADPAAAATTATFSTAGNYVLRLTAGDSQLTSSDDVSITVNPFDAGAAVQAFGPTPYLSFQDSPFRSTTFGYFHLENFEDHLLNTTGVSADTGGVTSVVFGPSVHDSVDADDGVIDGSGLNGDSYFAGNGGSGIKFTFDASVLGSLPTHAGLVWTDGAGQVYFEAFDRNSVSMGLRGPFDIPGPVYNGQTDEDRFFGVYNSGGISAIRVSNTSGGIELDHLQYGFLAPNGAPLVNAGLDQTISLPTTVTLSGLATDDGLPECSTLAISWSVVSGPGSVTFANQNAATTTATLGVPGQYVLRLTASDAALSTSDDVIVTANAGNQPPSVDAGSDQTVSLPNKSVGFFLNDVAAFNAAAGTPPVVVDFDNIAPGTDITGTTLSDITFDLPSAPGSSAPLIVTRASDTVTPSGFSGVIDAATNKLPATSGGNVLSPGGPQLGPGLNPLIENDDLKITFAQPVAAVGFDLLFQELDFYSAIGVTFLDANGNVLYANPLLPDGSGAGGGAPGGAVFVGFVSTRANIATIIIDESDGNNEFPDANIGFDTFRVQRLIPSTAIVNLSGIVTDDGLPPNSTVTSVWTKVSGPGSVTFDDPAQVVTKASFSDPGSYTLRLTASDSQLSSSDDVTITVNEGTVNYPPTVSAGDDQEITLPQNLVTLNGAATDDGQPSGSTIAVVWSQVGGPANVAFGSANLLPTTATFTAAGTYVLRLTASDSQLITTDEVVVRVYAAGSNQRPTANAGLDQTVALGANLIFNPGDEQPLINGLIPGWTAVQGTDWTQGSANSGSGFPNPQKGSAYFFANVAPQAELRQDIDVSAYAGAIATGTQQFEFQAYVRSATEAIPDVARVVLEYRNAANTSMIASLDSGLLSETTAWHLTEDVRSVPVGTGWIRVRLIATRNSGATNDAFFDSISLRPVGNVAVKLNGAVTDDGLPTGSTLSANWTAVSGPGPVTFSNANAAHAAASFTTAGTYVLRLTASDGQLSANDNATVTVVSPNQPPVVNAGGNQTITLPAPATLNGTATDDGQPQGSSLSVNWTKLSGPGDVTFANANAAATTASFSAAGIYVLRLTADDTDYSTGADVTISVGTAAGNQPPAVNAGADQSISLPTDTVTLNGTATDDGLPAGSTLTVSWTQISGPGVVTFGNANSAVTTAQFTSAGNYVLRLTASDSELSSSNDVNVTVTTANQPPTANAGADQTVLLSQGAQLDGSASDDGLPTSGNLTTTWTAVSGPGTVTFGNPNVTITGAQFSVAGTYVLRLTASDGALSASDDLTITVSDNVAAPTVEITAPADGSSVTEPAIVTGSVSGGAWQLEYSLASDDNTNNRIWTTFASGNGAVSNGQLGTLDPTMMLNGLFTIRLSATDVYGQTSLISISVVTEKNLKVGNFTVSFSDLNIPVAGVPMEVTRTYDTRDKRVGDFGFGWTMGLRNIRLEKSGVLGFKWYETVSQEVFPNYCLEATGSHLVTVTFPGGKVFKFQAAATPHCQRFAPVTAGTLSFTPMPGTHGTLQIVGSADFQVDGSVPGPVNLIGFNSGVDILNSSVFKFTAEDGTAFVIDQRTGLQSIADTNNNTVSVTAGGIIHSSGKSISFTRDSLGRITSVIDPAGNAQTYTYDAAGDLVSYTDNENNTSTYTYDTTHRLLTIHDPRGIQPIRNDYDADGRLISHTDGFGKVITYTHNLPSRVETVTDRLGHPTSFAYDERGNVLTKTDARGGVTRFTYDANDNVLTETNALGKTTTYTYDATDHRTNATDPLGNVTQFTYNALGRVLTTTDPLGHVTTNTYNGAGNLLTTKDALNNTTSFTYSIFDGQQISSTDALNNTTSYAYTGGYLTKETDALGNETTFIYDSNGNRAGQTVKRTNAQGHLETITTSYEYDKLNRLKKTTFADGSFTQVEYNAIGQQAATIDQLGRRTEFTYDDMGHMTRTNYPDGLHDETTYDAEGRRLTSKDRAGRITSFTYDELGRLTKTTYADSTFTSTTYDAAGQVLTSTDARGNVTHYEYDNAGRRTKVRNALNQETTFAYDANGNQLSMTDSLTHTTSYEYDGTNRRIKTTYPDSTFDGASYDAVGRSVSKTDQAGKTTQFTYDALGRLTKVKDALNQETAYGYNELGQQLSQTDANNHTTRFEYDQLGRRVKRTLPGGQFETYAYDTGGNLQHRTDFNGKTTTFTYDLMRRLLSKVPHPSLNQPTISFTYNTTGQRATMTDASGTSTYNYDGRSRLASKQTPFGTLSYTYDDAGSLLTTRSSNANGVSVDYSYDALSRLATVKDNNLGALNGGVTSYSYDTVGNLQSYLYPNGVTTTYNYNTLNRLTSMNANTAASTLASYAYTLGASGNRTAVTELSGRTVNYTYDDLYRLTNETIANDTHSINGTVSYGYDPVGNRLNRNSSVAGVPSQTSTYDANDRLTSDTYDNNGNTTAANSNSYAYDFENHLTSLNSGNVTYVYDGDGHRVSKSVGGITTNYLVDTNNRTGYAQVVEEQQGGSVLKSFTYGHDLISQRIVGSNLSFYQYDGHGSVRLLTDATAVVTNTYEYDAFGNLISRTGTTPNDYLYAGEQFDPNAGFYYLRARYMNPSSGRFWTMDRAEGNIYDPLTLHKYLYSNGDPVNRIDPSGRMSSELLVGLAVASIIASIAIIGVVYALTRPMPTRFVSFEWRNQWTLNNENLTIEEIQETKNLALENFRMAFRGFGVVVTNGQASNRIIVEGFSGGSAVGLTPGLANYSYVYYDDIRILADRIGKNCGITDRNEVLRGIGKAIGRVAAHEFGHQGFPSFTIHNTDDPNSYDYRDGGDTWALYYGELHWSERSLEGMRRNLAH